MPQLDVVIKIQNGLRLVAERNYMAKVTVATTPTFTCKFKDTDFSLATDICFNLENINVKLEKSGDSLAIDGSTISVYLSQEETLSLHEDTYAEIQFNWLYPVPNSDEYRRACSTIKSVYIGKNLKKEVMRHA